MDRKLITLGMMAFFVFVGSAMAENAIVNIDVGNAIQSGDIAWSASHQYKQAFSFAVNTTGAQIPHVDLNITTFASTIPADLIVSIENNTGDPNATWQGNPINGCVATIPYFNTPVNPKFQWKNATFSNCQLQANKMYWVVMNTSSTSGSNSNGWYAVQKNLTQTYANGNLASGTDGVWTQQPFEILIRVWSISSDVSSISITSPGNWSQYNNTVTVNFTATSPTLAAFPCWSDLDGNSTFVGNVTSGTYWSNLTQNGTGSHTLKITCGNGINTTSSMSFTTWLGRNNATLSSTGGWSLSEGAATTISCSAINGAATVFKDGIAVSNPYSLSASFGSYNFTCTSPYNATWAGGYDQQTLIVGLGAFNCLNSTTGIWKQDMSINNSTGNITIDFSAFTSQGQVWYDMRDVSFNNVSSDSVWRSTNSIIIKTNSSKQFSIYWGNGFGNQSWPVGTPAGAITQTLNNYSQANAYAKVSMKLEESGLAALPPNTNMTLTMGCDTGSSSFNLSNTTLYIPTFRSQFTFAKATATYSDNSGYFRQVLIFSQAADTSIYMTDAQKHTVLQIPLTISDLGYASWYITIYKSVGGSSVAITQGYLDTNNQFLTYLIKDEQYYIRLTSGSTTREAGFLYAYTAGPQSISIGTITTVPTILLVGNTVQASAAIVGNNLIITYGDLLQKTTSVRIRIYENTTQTPFYDSIFTGQQNITLTINNINTSSYYNVQFDVIHQSFGSAPVSFLITAAGSAPIFDFGLGAGSWVLQAGGFILLILIGFIATPRNRLGVLVLMGAITMLMFIFGWFAFSLAVAGAIILFLVLSVLYEIKRGGDA